MLPTALSRPERMGKAPAWLGLLGAGPTQVSTTLPSQLKPTRLLCSIYVPAAASWLRGTGTAPQPQDRPTARHLTVSLGRTRCWNELKAS